MRDEMPPNVSSVQEYLAKIEAYQELLNNNKANQQRKFYYRGQTSAYDYIIPSLLRNPGYVENENKLIDDFLKRMPELFNDCKNNLDRLALMQHHQLPTRLLDVTSDALVALYFATEPSSTGFGDRDGIIYLFSNSCDVEVLSQFLKDKKYPASLKDYLNKPQDPTKLWDKSAFSDEVQLEASIAKLNRDDRQKLTRDATNVLLRILSKKSISWTNFYRNQITMNHSWIKSFKYCSANKIYNRFNKSEPMQRLYHELRKDNGDFDKIIDLPQLLIPKIISPRIIDDRIRHQRGAFIMTPYPNINDEENSPQQQAADCINLLSLHYSDNRPITIKVPNCNKAKIHHELATTCGITQSFIYPDPTHMAEEISSAYEFNSQ